MKLKFAGLALGVGVLAFAGECLADGLKVGDHVMVGSINAPGTVIAVGAVQGGTGGTMVEVHLDRVGKAFPKVGSWFDSALSHVTVIGGGGNGPPAVPAGANADTGAPPPGAGQTAADQPPRINPDTQTRASAALCKQLIRDNYPPGGADQTITVSFLSFTMGGPRPYEAVYANDLAPPAGRGHTVQASPIHAKFTVLTHYADPQADDELRTYDAQYMCYRLPVGGWVAEMTSRLPGGEEAQYIHKG